MRWGNHRVHNRSSSSPFPISPSVTEVHQVTQSLLRTSLPSRLQTCAALIAKLKIFPWSEFFPGLGISAPVLCSPMYFPLDFKQVLWIRVSGCRPQTCLYRVFGQALSTDKLFGALVAFEKENGFMGGTINCDSSCVLDNQGTRGHAYPKELPPPEKPGNPPADCRRRL